MPVTITGGMTLVGGSQFTPPPPPPTYTALENISAGDPVSIDGDDVRKAKSVSSSAANTTLTTSGNARRCLYKHPSSGKLLFLHGSSNTIQYYVGTPGGSGVSWSSAKTLFTESGSNACYVFGLNNSEWNGNDTLLSLNYGGSYRYALITFNSSTDTLTMGTDFTSPINKPPTSMVYDSTYGVWAWVIGILNDSNGNLYLTNAGTGTTTTISQFPRSHKHSIYSSPNGGYVVTGCDRREDFGADSGDIRSTLISIDSATTASETDFVTYPSYQTGTDTAPNSGMEIGMAFDSSGNALSCWAILTNNYTTAVNRSVQGNFLTITSTSISAGTTFTAAANQAGTSSGNNSLMGTYFSNNKYYVYNKDPSTNNFNVSTFTNSSGSPGGQTIAATGISSPASTVGYGGGILFETSAGSAVWAARYDDRLVASEYFPATDYRSSLSGVAVSTVTTGNDTEVTIQGQVNTTVTGLANGTTYYVDTTGAITSSNTGFQIGTGNANGNLLVDIV